METLYKTGEAIRSPDEVEIITFNPDEFPRKWRVCSFVKMSAPEMSLSKARHILMATSYMEHRPALDNLWDSRSTVKGKGWIFWIEPDRMTPEEVKKYVPMDVRDELGMEQFAAN